MSIERLQIVVDALFKGKGELDKASQSVKDLDKNAGGAGKSTDKFTNSMGMLGTALKGAAIGALVTAGYKMIQFGKDSIQAASALEEMEAKFNVVFGDLAPQVTDSLRQLATETNRSTSTLMGMASAMQDTFVPMGFARDHAAELSQEMVKLAIDLSSFNNMSMDEALSALQGTLVGAHRNALRFGVVINENVLSQELMRMGAKDLTGELYEQAKIQARINLLLAGTADAQGDAIRTADSYANTVRGLEAAKGDLAETIGGILLPAQTELAAKTTEWVRALEQGINLAAGQYRQGLAETTAEVVKQAESVNDLISRAKGLSGAYNDLNTAQQMIAKSAVRDSVVALAEAMAANSESFEEFQAAVNAGFSGQAMAQFEALFATTGRTRQQFFEAAQEANRYARAVEEAAQADGILTRQLAQSGERVDYLAQAYRNGIYEIEAYDTNSRSLESTIRRARRETEEKRIATEAAAEADRIAAERTERLAQSYGGLFMEALRANSGVGLYLEGTTEAGEASGYLELANNRVGRSFMEVAEQGGLTMEQIAILGGAYGIYSGEALQAAINTALIRSKMEELVEKVKDGELSVYDLRRQMEEYVATLDTIPGAITTDITANVRVNYPDGALPINIPGYTLPEGTEFMNAGGRVRGGIAGRDSVPAMLTPGEIVLPTWATNNMDAAMSFLSDHMPGQTTSTHSVNVHPGAIVINAAPGMNEGAIANAVIDQLNSRLGRQADARMRL